MARVSARPAQLPLSLVIEGPPRTKKNHGRRVYSFRHKRTFNVPSEAYETWETQALAQLLPRRLPMLPDQPYNCTAVFYRQTAVGDAVGYYQALADCLQKAKLVRDDKWIVSWDGSRLAVDRRRPRVELTITPAAP